MNKYILLGLLMLIFASAGCGIFQQQSQVATDYSQADHWLSLPTAEAKPVDIFYIYPTCWQKINSTDPDICNIDNPIMLTYSRLALASQATVFETTGNIYAPYFRQIDTATHFSMTTEEAERVIAGIPTLDVVAAFDYYIKHYNNGRPFILAGHSQGSNVLANILSGYMKDNPEVYSRMISAYVIGYSITSDYLARYPHLKFATGPDDTGVIISYNTQAPDVATGTNVVLLPGGISINPITWTTEETLATAAQNLGSITLNPDKTVKDGLISPVMNYADAQVDKAKGAVICSVADEDTLSPGTAIFVRGVYHSYDYSFYYYDLRANAANRANRFLSK